MHVQLMGADRVHTAGFSRPSFAQLQVRTLPAWLPAHHALSSVELDLLLTPSC